MKKFNWMGLCLVLLVISGILWGLVGLFDFYLVMYLFGPCWATRLLYFIFGFAAICLLAKWIKGKK